MRTDKKTVQHKDNSIGRLEQRNKKNQCAAEQKHHLEARSEKPNDRVLAEKESRCEQETNNDAAEDQCLSHLVRSVGSTAT